MKAYAVNPSKTNKLSWPYINFCIPFFELDTLAYTIDTYGKDELLLERYSLVNYENRGEFTS
jgi:hypothetical protein